MTANPHTRCAHCGADLHKCEDTWVHPDGLRVATREDAHGRAVEDHVAVPLTGHPAVRRGHR